MAIIQLIVFGGKRSVEHHTPNEAYVIEGKTIEEIIITSAKKLNLGRRRMLEQDGMASPIS